MNDIIREKLALLPAAPGVYKMYDASGEVIYVGKAISLKNRVRQYFKSGKPHTPKVAAMVSHIADFDTVQVSNETEALSLECNFIKQYRPKYNILLKDDKQFPYVRIDMRQDFPRIDIVRRVSRDGAKYIGPFLSGLLLRDGMQAVREHFPVRHCKKDIPRAIARRERPCLMYHIGKCCAPCSGQISRAQYHAMLEQVIAFLSGHSEKIVAELRTQMEDAANSLQFERAAMLRDRIRAISSLSEKQAVIAVNAAVSDVLAVARQDKQILVFALFVRGGKVVGTERYRMGEAEEASDGEVLAAFLTQHYADAVQIPTEILIRNAIDDQESVEAWLSSLAHRRVHLHRPQRGDKHRLVELAYRNGLDALAKDAELLRRAWERGEGAVAMLSQVLGLEDVPSRLECFDNSHLQGRDTVSSMVVFTDGQPNRKAYRRFRIRAEAGGDDLIAMREALMRRFDEARMQNPSFLPLPGLLVVDGGRTQLDVACEVLAEHGLSHLPVIGLAEAHELVYLPGRDEPLRLPENSAALHLLERIRDEAHRFAITYHRNLRAKNALFSVLDNVQGIGDKRKRALFDAFITLDALKSAPVEALAAVPGMNLPAATALRAYFDSEKASD